MAQLRDDGLTIPAEAIYKVFRYDAQGEVSQIYVFAGGLRDREHMELLFSAPQLAFIRAKGVDVSFSKFQIHADDSVGAVKKKLIHEVGAKNISYDEIYLFCFVDEWIRLDAIYRDITEDGKRSLSPAEFAQLAENLAVPDAVLAAVPAKPEYDYEDIATFDRGRAGANVRIRTSLGRRFVQRRDHTFSANPYRVVSDAFKPTTETRLDFFENELLMNYGDIVDREIHLCLARDVFAYFSDAPGAAVDTKYITNVYYPFLLKRGVFDLHTLAMRRREMIADNAKVLTEFALKTYRSVDVFHQIYYNRSADIIYMSRGVKSFSATVRDPHPSPILLDVLFKKMHATEAVPFIVLSPAHVSGVRKETITRLYSDRVSKNGRKAPAMSDEEIGKLSRELPSPNHITAFIPGEEASFVVEVCGDGALRVKGTATVEMSVARWDILAADPVKAFVGAVNDILHPTGRRVPGFKGLGHQSNSEVDIRYRSTLSVSKDGSIKGHLRCIGAVFSVAEDRLSHGALRLRRVENYREMDELSAFVASAHNGPAHDPATVVAQMMEQFDIDKDAAVDAYSAHLDESRRVREHAHDNPGFPVKLSMSPIERVLTMEVSGITCAAYIEPLFIYLDTVVRMTQFPDSSRLGRHAFSSECAVGSAAARLAPLHKENVEAPMEAAAAPRGATAISASEFLNPDADVDAGADDEGFVFGEYDDDDEFDDDAGAAAVPEPAARAAPPPDDAEISVDGIRINDPSYFFERIKTREPNLILSRKEGKYDAYARACPANAGRQPVILTNEEKERIDREHPGSYNHALKHGSDPDKPSWYICPRYWCLKTNSSMTQAEVDSGVCGGIISKTDTVVPPGKYVYEFTSPKHVRSDESYVEYTPGFLKKDTHPRFALPCCFSNDWASKFMVSRRAEAGYVDDAAVVAENARSASQTRNVAFIISANFVPLDDRRWGFMPSCAAKFLQTSYRDAVKNIHHMMDNKPCFLRYGVEQTSASDQSFIGCFAEFYAHAQGLAAVPRVAEMRGILAGAVSLDRFIRYHHGSLAAIFRPASVRVEDIDTTAHAHSAFFKSLDLADETQMDFLENTVAAFDNFVAFLRDPGAAIDHTYLWDIFADDNPLLMPGGANLIILSAPRDDVTDNIEMLCPTGSFSGAGFAPDRDTFIVLRQDVFYEPIYLYEERGAKVAVVKSFGRQSVPNNVSRLLTVIEKTADKHCSPKPSLPRSVYSFKRNAAAARVLDELARNRATVHQQVLNYQAKVVALTASFAGDAPVSVPCLPSSMLPDLPAIYMDDAAAWRDYRATVRLLRRVSEGTAGAVLCAPSLRVVDDGMIVGVLTETNQFVSISPPLLEADAVGDGLPSLAGENYVLAERALTAERAPDPERLREVHNISLESGFYTAFRALARRRLLVDFKNRAARKRVTDLIANRKAPYRDRLRGVMAEMRAIMAGRVEFRAIEPAALAALGDIAGCPEEHGAGAPAYCLAAPLAGSKECLFVVPDKHLITGADNERVYYARLADELVRYSRARLFMFSPKVFMNVSAAHYAVNATEILVLQHSLAQTFRDSVHTKSSYVKNTAHETAQPSASPSYSNRVSASEQADMARARPESGADAGDHLSDYKANCVAETRSIKGNRQTSIWVRSFPYAARETYFRPSAECSFAPILCIMDRVHPNTATVESVKARLAAEYTELMKTHAAKISIVLKMQGKRDMMARLERGAVTMAALVASDEYYISDLDLWVFFRAVKVPVIIFYSTSCKMVTSADINWLFLSGDLPGSINSRIHFVRSPANIVNDLPYSYSLVSAAYKYTEMGEFSSVARAALSDADASVPNVQSLSTFLSQMVVVKRRR